MSRRTRFWLVTLITALGVATTLSLGRWQLSRAAQKEALHDAIEQRRLLPPLTGSGWLGGKPTQLLHRPVLLRGRFEPQHSVFLENRQMHGHPGFFVLTPLRIENSPSVVMVQRGWIPRNFLERATLPDIPTPDEVVQIEGRIAPEPAKLFEFKGAEAGRIRQNLDLSAFGAETGLLLLPFTVLQIRAAADDGLLRDWPTPGSGVEKHYGYAFQWFGLAALMAFLYVWYQFIRPQRRNDPAAAKSS